MTSKVLEQRIRFEPVPFTRLQRFRLWVHGVRVALLTPPETHWSRRKIINPGDPGYDSPFNFIVYQRTSPLAPINTGATLTNPGINELSPADFAKLP